MPGPQCGPTVGLTETDPDPDPDPEETAMRRPPRWIASMIDATDGFAGALPWQLSRRSRRCGAAPRALAARG